MSKIELFNLRNLRNNEDYSYHRLIIKGFEYLPTDDGEGISPLKEIKDSYKSAFDKFDEAYIQKSKLFEVEELNLAEAEADEAYAATRMYVIAMKRSYDGEQKLSAEVIGRVFDAYPYAITLGYSEKLSVYRNLLQDLNEVHNDYIKSINFSGWISYFTSKTNALEEKMKIRTDAESKKEKGLIQITRDAADEGYRKFIDRVNVVAAYEGESEYLKYMDYVNALIKQYRTIVKIRLTKNFKKKNKNEEEEEQKEEKSKETTTSENQNS